MVQLSPGQIYLADQRGLDETSAYRRYSTFNYGAYADDSRAPFGQLQVVNDELLAASQSIELTIEQNSYNLIIPITGEVVYGNSYQTTTLIDVGEVYLEYKPASSRLRLTNPYEDNCINFLYLQFATDESTSHATAQRLHLDLSSHPNKLIEVVGSNTAGNQLPFTLHIGQFAGRHDALFTTQSLESRMFAFVIAGAFECQGRLLHERDGLALWSLAEADLEALSNNAVMLLIEL